MIVKLLTEHLVSKLKRRLHRLVRVYTCQNATLLEISCTCSIILLLLSLCYSKDAFFVAINNKLHVGSEKELLSISELSNSSSASTTAF